MIMETKNVTIRLTEDVINYINRKELGITEGIKDVIRTLQRHELLSMCELKGKFTEGEWKFLVDSLNGSLVSDEFRFSPSALIAHNQDSQVYEGTADKWDIDLNELNAKCEKLTASQTDALYRRVEKFWEHPETDINEWAKY